MVAARTAPLGLQAAAAAPFCSARIRFHSHGDVDVFVEFEEDKRTYDNFFALHELLETLLGRRVELVTDKGLNETKARLILPTVRYASVDG